MAIKAFDEIFAALKAAGWQYSVEGSKMWVQPVDRSKPGFRVNIVDDRGQANRARAQLRRAGLKVLSDEQPKPKTPAKLYSFNGSDIPSKEAVDRIDELVEQADAREALEAKGQAPSSPATRNAPSLDELEAREVQEMDGVYDGVRAAKRLVITARALMASATAEWTRAQEAHERAEADLEAAERELAEKVKALVVLVS